MSDKKTDFLCEHIESRLDAIEKQINLLLLSSVMNQMDEVCQSNCEDDLITEELKEILYQYAFELDKIEKYADKMVMYIKSLEQISIVIVRLISALIQDNNQDLIPVFIFERLSRNQKKKM